MPLGRREPPAEALGVRRPSDPPSALTVPGQLAVEPMDEPTLENVVLALEPRVVMAAMQTTMMRASMTAYSTAVGPSSFRRNSTTVLVSVRIGEASVWG